MKGCLGLLVLLLVLAIGEYVALGYTPMSGSIGLPIISAVLLTLAITQVWGLIAAIQKGSALGKNPTQWRDGEFVGCSGRIVNDGDSVTTPGSGQLCSLYEYSLKQRYSRRMNSGNGARTESGEQSHFMGMAMAGCSVQAGVHRFRLFGFPLLQNLPVERHGEPIDLDRMAGHLLSSQISSKDVGIGTVLGELNSVLQDADGIVLYNTACRDSHDLGEYRTLYESDPQAAQRQLADYFLAHHFFVEERRVPESTEVTVFGKYQSTARAIHIGSGLQNVNHGLSLGGGAKVAHNELRKSIIFLTVFGALAASLHAWLLPPLLSAYSAERYAGRGLAFSELIEARFEPAQGQQRLRQALLANDVRLARLLLDIGVAGSVSDDGEQATLLAVTDVELAQLLLERGSDPNRTNEQQETPLMLAAERGDFALVQLLVKHRAQLDLRDRWGNTALIRAAKGGHLEISEVLLAAGVDSAIRNDNGATALDEARAEGQTALAEFLLARGVRETEVTAGSGEPVDLRHPGVAAVNAYLAAIHARDGALASSLVEAFAGTDWSETDWDAFLSGRPLRVSEVIGYSDGSRATVRVDGPDASGTSSALQLGFALRRDGGGRWQLEREWIEWGEHRTRPPLDVE